MDAYQLETTTDRILLEDGTGVLLLEQQIIEEIVGGGSTTMNLMGVGN